MAHNEESATKECGASNFLNSNYTVSKIISRDNPITDVTEGVSHQLSEVKHPL